MQITFLGTGSMLPTKERNPIAVYFSYKNENILFDCGEGTQRQFKFANLSPSKVSRILLTHWHGDHVLGLPGLFQTLKMNDYTKALNIYGPKRTTNFTNELNKLPRIERTPVVSYESSWDTKSTKYNLQQSNNCHRV